MWPAGGGARLALARIHGQDHGRVPQAERRCGVPSPAGARAERQRLERRVYRLGAPGQPRRAEPLADAPNKSQNTELFRFNP